ncbi:MAG TPA: DNA starvation/stationary phase protection protein [Ktedonobacterales bacterium]|nr:DNA starvation/stationary phase protection protein [Ktedonobacterales bacterium]
MSTPTQTRPGQQDMQARGNVSVRSFPAPKQLATVTDLNSQEAQAITEAVNPLIADALALFTKTKNFHWHLSGSHFRDFHLLFDTHADELLESVDIMAERVRRVGGTTIRSIGHISQLQTIQDDNDDFVSAGEMIRRLMEDNLHIAKKQRAAIEVCDKHRDSVTSNLLQEILDQTEKRKWFLFEILQGVNNTD